MYRLVIVMCQNQKCKRVSLIMVVGHKNKQKITAPH